MKNLNVLDNVVQLDGTLRPLGDMTPPVPEQEVLFREKPNDPTKAQYKTKDGTEWVDFSSGGGVLLYTNPSPTQGKYNVAFNVPNLKDYPYLLIEFGRSIYNTTRAVIEYSSSADGYPMFFGFSRNDGGGSDDRCAVQYQISGNTMKFINVWGGDAVNSMPILHIWGYKKLFN